MLTPEKVIEIKKQLLKQIENLPQDKREQAKQQIESMTAEELETFLKQNNLVKSETEVIKEKPKPEKIQEQKTKELEKVELPKRIP